MTEMTYSRVGGLSLISSRYGMRRGSLEQESILGRFWRLVSRQDKSRGDNVMADNLEDLGIPMRPARTKAELPPRTTDLLRPNGELRRAPDALSSTKRADQVGSRSLIVGPGISLSGDISSCDRLVIEGNAEVTLHDCSEIEIAETGLFKGNALIEQAEVSGRFEGELVVHKRLLVRATGRVSGSITYGEIEIERGGQVSGTLHAQGWSSP